MKEILKIIFPVSANSVRIADDIFEVLANNTTQDKQLRYNIRMVLSEAFNNAFLHGDKSSRNAVIEVKACFTVNGFMVSITNDGRGFTDNEIKWDELPSTEAESGRGLKLIKNLSDKVDFKRTANNKFEIQIEFNTNITRQQIK